MEAVQSQRRSSFRGVLIGSAVLAVLAAGSAGGYWAGSLSTHSARTIIAPVEQGNSASLELQGAGSSARFIDPTTGTDEGVTP